MSDSSDDSYTLENDKNEIGILHRVTDDVVAAIENTESEELLEYLIEDQELEVTHDGGTWPWTGSTSSS